MSRFPLVAITGASAGVGRAVALRFAAPSVRLALMARDAEALEAAVADAEPHGAQARACPLDVADAPGVLAAAEEIAGAWGGVDLWINDAMVTVFAPHPEKVRRVTDVTYLGPVHGTLAALRLMRRRNRG